MVDAVVQVGLELLANAFLGVADAGEVGHGDALAILPDLLQNLQVLAHVGAAGAVGAGNVVRIQSIQLIQHTALAAQLLHTNVRLGGEHFKGKRAAGLQNVGNAHDELPPMYNNNGFIASSYERTAPILIRGYRITDAS